MFGGEKVKEEEEKRRTWKRESTGGTVDRKLCDRTVKTWEKKHC